MREQDRKAQETRKMLGPRLGRSKTARRVLAEPPAIRSPRRRNRLPGDSGW